MGGGGVLVRFDGAIVGGTDMVQHAYPLQLLLFSSNGDYLRFDLTSGGFSGNNGALSDGLSAADAAVLLGEGTADPSPVLVFLSANRIDLRIGDAPPAGPATAVLFVLDEEGILLSNSVPVTLPAVAAP